MDTMASLPLQEPRSKFFAENAPDAIQMNVTGAKAV
jgi:hypothetical protein